MRKIPLILTAFLCTAMTFGSAFASEGSGGNPSQHLIERLDRDGDKQVSKDEFPGPDAHFSQMDLDGNGFITQEEASQASLLERQTGQGDGSVPGQFTEDDADGDGVVSRTEFSGPADHFDRLDVNSDGVIEESEARQGPPGMARLERGNR